MILPSLNLRSQGGSELLPTKGLLTRTITCLFGAIVKKRSFCAQCSKANTISFELGADKVNVHGLYTRRKRKIT